MDRFTQAERLDMIANVDAQLFPCPVYMSEAQCRASGCRCREPLTPTKLTVLDVLAQNVPGMYRITHHAVPLQHNLASLARELREGRCDADDEVHLVDMSTPAAHRKAAVTYLSGE
jgi:hypothetical protein